MARLQPIPPKTSVFLLQRPFETLPTLSVSFVHLQRERNCAHARQIGKTVRLSAEYITLNSIARCYQEQVNPAFRVTAHAIPLEEFRKQPGCEELYLNMKFFMDHGPESQLRDVQECRQLFPALKDFVAWAREHQSEIESLSK